MGRRFSAMLVGGLALLACSAAGRAQTLTPTTTTLTGVASPINYGDVIANSGIETVSPGPDGGTIDFTINGVVACTLLFPSPPNTNECPPSTGAGYPVGSYVVQSVYSGDATYAASESATQTVIILPVITGPATSVFGNPVTFTTTVGDAQMNALGTVNFMEGATVLGSNPVTSGGTASFTTSSLAVGTHNITGCLLDSADGKTYCSQPLTIVVSAPIVTPPPPPTGSFALAVNPASISVGVGNSLSVQVEVTALNGFSQAVQLGCSGLPKETTCTFEQSLIPGGGGSTALIVSPAAPHSCGVSTPDFVAPNLRIGMAGLLLSFLAMFGLRRRRRLAKRLVAAVVLVAGLGALSGLGGCGGKCKDFGTEPAIYTFTVTGTSMGSPVDSQAVTVKMDVHL